MGSPSPPSAVPTMVSAARRAPCLASPPAASRCAGGPPQTRLQPPWRAAVRAAAAQVLSDEDVLIDEIRNASWSSSMNGSHGRPPSPALPVSPKSTG